MINFPQRNWTDYGGEVNPLNRLIPETLENTLRLLINLQEVGE